MYRVTRDFYVDVCYKMLLISIKPTSVHKIITKHKKQKNNNNHLVVVCEKKKKKTASSEFPL